MPVTLLNMKYHRVGPVQHQPVETMEYYVTDVLCYLIYRCRDAEPGSTKNPLVEETLEEGWRVVQEVLHQLSREKLK